MNTLYDYLTHIKGVEYLISIGFIAAYIVYAEILKPKPFKALREDGKEELDFVRSHKDSTLTTLRRIVAAPFIGIGYVVMLPFAFAYALVSAVAGTAMNAFGKTAVFGWRPTEAYLTGKKKKEEKRKEK